MSSGSATDNVVADRGKNLQKTTSESLNEPTMDLNLSQVSSKNDDELSPSAAPMTPASPSSSAKSTPTKSKNKKKNEKRRSANLKKQAAATAAAASSSGAGTKVTKPTSIDASETTTLQQRQQNKHSTLIGSTESNKDRPKQIQSEEDQLQQMESKSPSGEDVSPAKKSSEPSNQVESGPDLIKSGNDNNLGNNGNPSKVTNHAHDMNSWKKKKEQELKDLRDQLKLKDSQLEKLTDRVRQQTSRIKELETSLIGTTRTCNKIDKILQQELSNRNKLEAEVESSNQTITRLRTQISALEKNKTTNDELIRVLNATLMERETEVSILKLKMTRMQTNPSNSMLNNSNANVSTVKQIDPAKSFALSGRSNSEFCRNSYIRSSMMAEAASVRSSTTQLQTNDRDAFVWAKVPEELTPSKRPLILERNLHPIYGDNYDSSPLNNKSSTPILRDRRYRTLPRSMKSPTSEQAPTPICVDNDKDSSTINPPSQQNTYCLVTNLDESNSTSHSSGGNKTLEEPSTSNISNTIESGLKDPSTSNQPPKVPEISQLGSGNTEGITNGMVPCEIPQYATIGNDSSNNSPPEVVRARSSGVIDGPPSLPSRTPSTPVRVSSGLKKIFGVFRRSDSSAESKSRTDLHMNPPSTPIASPFQRGATRSTLVGPPGALLSPRRKISDFQTDKPFAEWDTDMLCDWLQVIGLSMYVNQCRRWVRCGAHIMNATPAEVDKGLGITNHLHRKKLRLAISELNGDCDKITKAAAKLDYLWVARWLDDIGLPQHKEAFINARIDGRVLNYLTVEDLVSMGIKSVLHHASIKSGIRVLRSINFDLQCLRRRATAEEVEQMSSMRQRLENNDQNFQSLKNPIEFSSSAIETDIPLWTCFRVMEWLRAIDFAEFAPNLRGSGVHGGLIMFEDAFNIDTMCSLLSIPSSRTLLRRHLSSYFENLVGKELAQRKRQHKEISSNHQLNPTAEIKTPKKMPSWFSKLKTSKVGQDGMDEYLCPMYPVEPQLIKTTNRKLESSSRDLTSLPRIPESVNV